MSSREAVVFRHPDALRLTTRRQIPKSTGRHGWRTIEAEVFWQPMVRRGFNVVLVRDLTDALYNPLRPPM